MSLAVRIVFVVFVASLLITLVGGLCIVWEIEPPSEAMVRIIATAAIVMSGALFFLGASDAVTRVLSKQRRLRDNPKD